MSRAHLNSRSLARETVADPSFLPRLSTQRRAQIDAYRALQEESDSLSQSQDEDANEGDAT